MERVSCLYKKSLMTTSICILLVYVYSGAVSVYVAERNCYKVLFCCSFFSANVGGFLRIVRVL